MKIDITNKKANPLFNRTELTFEVHQDAETPSRNWVIKEIANIMKVDESLIVVDYIRQPFGTKKSHGRAKVYKSESDMKIESKHLVERAKKSLGKLDKKQEGAAPSEAPKQ